MQRLRPMMRGHTRLLAVLAGLAFVVALVGHGAGPVAAAPIDLAAATVVSAGTGPALFTRAGLVPGDRRTRCLDVALPSPSGRSTVLLRAEGVSGALASSLLLVVESGPAAGGAAGSCAGFVGSEVYRGTLGDLAALSGAAPYGATTGWTLTATDQVRAFRFTVEVADLQSAQGLTTQADLLWAAVADPGPAPRTAPSAPPTAAPTTTPSTSPSAAPTAAPSAPPTAAPTTAPSETPIGQAGPALPAVPGVRSTDQRSGTGGPRASDGEPGSPVRPVIDVPVQITETIVGTAKQSGFPATLFGVVFVFLLVQDNLDRRDPKLALAPMEDDDSLPFTTGLLG